MNYAQSVPSCRLGWDKILILMARRGDDKGIKEFLIWDCGFSIGHLASPSLGHYASLSFVVIGRGKRKGERDFPVGAAFPPCLSRA